jgi:uncharacterized protein YcgI (DUF1989 family)
MDNLVIPIPAREGWSASLKCGDTMRLIDVEGGQAADLWAYNPADHTEFLSAQHSRVHMGQAYPVAGWTFVTNQRRPILEFTRDDSPGRHDCLAAACDRFRYQILGADSGHASCEDTLIREAATHDIHVSRAPQPFNVFANFRVEPDGTFNLDECLTKAGDSATFTLLADAVVVISACPQDIVGFQPGGPTSMAVEISSRRAGDDGE